jgi:cytochrome c oxidase subunit 2
MRTRYLVIGSIAAVLLLAPFSDPGAAGGQAPDPRVIEITARRFAFEPATVEVMAGERIRLVVRSGDGLHGIEIKAFKVNKEVPRGNEPVTIDFTPAEPGQYPIICSTYCGNGHDDMKGMLVVAARPSL